MISSQDSPTWLKETTVTTRRRDAGRGVSLRAAKYRWSRRLIADWVTPNIAAASTCVRPFTLQASYARHCRKLVTLSSIDLASEYDIWRFLMRRMRVI
jgi:hypothetical protein